MAGFKYAKDYSWKELVTSCQPFFGGQFWVWYKTVSKAVREEKAKEILHYAYPFYELGLEQ